jgi:ATP-dependent Clp protease ATP-binding subunit ClpB
VQAAQTIAAREATSGSCPSTSAQGAARRPRAGLPPALITRAGGDAKRNCAGRRRGRRGAAQGLRRRPDLSRQATARVLAEAERSRKKAGDSFVTAERLLVALA